jgi:hypothetical protein
MKLISLLNETSSDNSHEIDFNYYFSAHSFCTFISCKQQSVDQKTTYVPDSVNLIPKQLQQ